MELSANSDEVTPRHKPQRTQEIHRLMRELQCKKQVSTLCDRCGQVHLTGTAIAQCLKEHWDSVSTPSRVGVDKLSEYLNMFLPLKKLKSSLPLLLRPANITLVLRLLDQPKDSPSPGMDGVSAKIYKTFESFFLPLMHQTYSYLLGGGGGAARQRMVNMSAD